MYRLLFLLHFGGNNAFSVEDLESTKEIHKEEADTPMILLPRNSHSGNIHPLPSCHFRECAWLWVWMQGWERDSREGRVADNRPSISRDKRALPSWYLPSGDGEWNRRAVSEWCGFSIHPLWERNCASLTGHRVEHRNDNHQRPLRHLMSSLVPTISPWKDKRTLVEA